MTNTAVFHGGQSGFAETIRLKKPSHQTRTSLFDNSAKTHKSVNCCYAKVKERERLSLLQLNKANIGLRERSWLHLIKATTSVWLGD